MKFMKLVVAAFLLSACTTKQPVKPEDVPPVNKVEKDRVVSFMAVGDNLIHNSIYIDAKNRHGKYDFNDMYENIKDFVQSKDVAYINQETILGGTKLELSNYPMFNSPQEVGDALVNTGFDWIASCSNHSMDRFEAGIMATLNFWDKYPDVVTTGLNRSEEEANQLKYIERNGVKIGILGYTYGTNGIDLPEGKEYLVNLYSKDRIKKDVERLKGTCDAIVVSMHWGEEYSTTVSAKQQELAQFMADLGVNAIIGEHPHVIEPMDWVTGKDGHQMLVIYSLGNLLSAQIEPINMLGGCAAFDLRISGMNGKVTVENVKFYPTVNHFIPTQRNFKVYFLKDYTDQLASQHELNVSRQYFIYKTNEIMNDKFEIIY